MTVQEVGCVDYSEAEEHAGHSRRLVSALNTVFGINGLDGFQVCGSVSAHRDNEIRIDRGSSGNGGLGLDAGQCERLAHEFMELAKYLRSRA